MKIMNHGMKNSLLRGMLCILVVLIMLAALQGQAVQAFTTYGLDWDTVNYPARSLNQTFTNVNGTGVNMIFTVSAPAPTTMAELTGLVDNTNYSGTGTNSVQSLVESVNFTDDANQMRIVVEFSIPVSNVSFTMHDIDRSELLNLWNINWIYYFDFMDRVEFQALSSDGSSIVQPVFSNQGICVELIGAVAQGTGLNRDDSRCYDLLNGTTNYGDVTVTFPTEISRFQITLSNVTNKSNWLMNFNPALQRIGLGDISFDSAYDFGDLPDSYSTSGINGARHYVPATPMIYLGTVAPDDEFVAHVSVEALGDDGDEDAFTTFPGIGVNLATFEVSIPLVNNSGSDAYLDGWIDFNMDGVFSQDEYATSTVAIGQTSANLSWSSLPLLTVGNTFARLRISSDHSALNTATSAGTLPNGEVEDYSVVIQSATAVTLSSFAGGSTQPGWLAFVMASLGVALAAFMVFKRNKFSLQVGQ